MEKIYIEVTVPGVNKSYDVVISPELKISEAAKYIFNTVSEYEMLEIKEASPVLCDARLKKIYSGDQTLADCNIHDGSKLILV